MTMTDRIQGSSPAGIVLEGALAELREREIRLLVESGEGIASIPPDGSADRQRLTEAANDLREMFLMVAIIGEFNAGKSTFVNALIGEPLLPMGITPTTDMIELIRYASMRGGEPTIRDNAVREWTHPNTGSAGVAIVDTPGTGSVFQKHEAIAKSFLHRSDLVIFLVSAKRAFADTERIYLELAKSYGKKIIIVINQSDLLEEPERREVRKFVQQQVDQLLDLRPPIFVVSAKRALAEPKPGILPPEGMVGDAVELSPSNEYGMRPLRAHLRTVFEQVPPAQQKLITQIELLKSILNRYVGTVGARLSLIGQDTDAAEALQKEIENQAGALERQMNSALSDVQGTLKGVLDRGTRFIEDNIKVLRATLRGVDKEKIAQEFERTVIGDAVTRLSSVQEQYVNALVDGSRTYWRGVIERLSKLDALLREESVSMDASSYADQRAALQAALTMADIELKAYSDNQVIQDIEAEFDQNVRTFTYSLIGGTGGALAVLLSIIGGVAVPGAALPPLAIIGLIVGVPAMIGGGVVAARLSRKATQDARQQLESRLKTLEDNYRLSMVKLTSDERNRLVQYGQRILSPVFSQLQALAGRYKDQKGRIESYLTRANELAEAIRKV